jgi:hypothetical protein
MAVDQFELLAWLADRETQNPGALPTGNDVRIQAAHLDRDQQQGPVAVSQALARLRGQGCISWVFSGWPNRPTEPPSHRIDDTTIQQVCDIAVTTAGYAVLAARRPPIPTQQINIVGSTVGQLALGNLQNVSLVMILDAAERELALMRAPEETKAEVRSALQRMRQVGGTVATGAGAELLASVVRRALGLP